ncbi:MAG: antitoxin, RHH family protein [Caldisericota bacterium]|nr:antitoxin, RHH family protein [Caldisericota bacterium]
MATKKPRVNVVLDKNIYNVIKSLSGSEDMSMSSTIRDLVKEALELREDIVLSKFAEEREKTFDKSKALSHKENWG